jgi:hypothetical protein
MAMRGFLAMSYPQSFLAFALVPASPVICVNSGFHYSGNVVAVRLGQPPIAVFQVPPSHHRHPKRVSRRVVNHHLRIQEVYRQVHVDVLSEHMSEYQGNRFSNPARNFFTTMGAFSIAPSSSNFVRAAPSCQLLIYCVHRQKICKHKPTKHVRWTYIARKQDK